MSLGKVGFGCRSLNDVCMVFTCKSIVGTIISLTLIRRIQFKSAICNFKNIEKRSSYL
jgi:hypothetical protein